MSSDKICDDFPTVPVLRFDVSFLHLLPGKYGPATILYHEQSKIVILIVHAYETKGLILVLSKDLKRKKMTDYYFYRSKEYKDNHPVLDGDVFQCVYFGDYERYVKIPEVICVPAFLLEIATNQVLLQEKLRLFLEENDYVLPVSDK